MTNISTTTISLGGTICGPPLGRLCSCSPARLLFFGYGQPAFPEACSGQVFCFRSLFTRLLFCFGLRYKPPWRPPRDLDGEVPAVDEHALVARRLLLGICRVSNLDVQQVVRRC